MIFSHVSSQQWDRSTKKCAVSRKKELLPEHNIMSWSLSSSVRTLSSTCVRTNEEPEKRPRRQKFPCFALTVRLREKKKNKSRTCLTCKMRTKPLSHYCHGDLFVWNLIEMGSVWSTFVKILIGNDKDCSIKKALKLNNSTTLTIEQAKNCTCLLYNTHISSIRVTH